MSNLRERLASLSPEKRALLMKKLRQQKNSAKPAASANGRIPSVTRETRLPLSYAQQRLWFLAQLGGGDAYNVAGALRLSGDLDTGALHNALQTIVQRHEIFRTTYRAGEDGEPYLAILPEATVLLPVIAAREEATIQAEIDAIRNTTFDLSADVMLRAKLLAVAEQEHILLLVVHHIATDAWSNNLLIRELTTLYAGESLPPLSIQYADFAHWQRSQNIDEQIAYWKTQLDGELPILDLPTDFARPQVQDQRGAGLEGVISAEITTHLKTLAQQERVTMFMLLLTAFKLLLWRQTDQDDIIVGTPVAGRNEPAAEPLIGLFLNTLALRSNLSGNPTFRELLAQVRGTTLDAYAHQEMPFEKLVETVHPERSLGRHPIFEVMLNLINVPRSEAELAGLTIRPIEEPNRAAKFTMTLYVSEDDGQLNLHLVYQKALFTAERMQHFLAQFKALLAQIVADADRPIGNYSLVTEKIRSLLPDPTRPISKPDYRPIPTRFTMLAEQLPDQPAIEWDGKQWTYRQMVADATAIAHTLVAHGVEKGDVVGINGSRSYGTIVSMIGVLLSGGVMLNLADRLPEQRQKLMLSEADARLVLNVGMPVDLLDETLHVDPQTARVAEASTDKGELPTLTGVDRAYIFFTSGTTGKPKGVLGNHKGLSHFLTWQRETFAVGSADRASQLTGLSFDVVLRDTFLPLTSGATLCIPPEGTELDPNRILRWLDSANITLMHVVPSLAQAWLVHAADRPVGSVRWSFFAGEPLTDTLVRQWRSVFTNTRIANLYGPTETTMAKCCFIVPNEPLVGVQPVGSPLPQTQALILNAQGNLCGIGETGQIVIRTPYCTYGYINVPAAKSQFAPNPFGDNPDDLVYYTGDQGRYRPDGTIDILGRMDFQVKIRGVRIELGEIKAVLDEHPTVGESIVVARQEGTDKLLVAYVVPATSFNEAALRGHLSQRLPAAMQPSAVVELDHLPLTPNGKVNRRALPAPEIKSEAAYIAPRDAVEQQLVKIWQDILNTDTVGVEDSFFDLGGHSLLAVRLMAAIRPKFNQNLPLATLFQNPTIAALATHLRQSETYTRQAWSPLVRIQPQGENPPFFCVPGAGGNVLYFYHLARHLGKDRPFIALQARGLDGRTPPHATIEATAADYLAAIKTIQPTGPYYIGGHSFGGKIAFEMAQQLHKRGERIAFLGIFDSSSPTRMRLTDRSGWDEAQWLIEVANVMSAGSQKEIELAYETLRDLSAEQRMSAFKQALEASGFLPDGADITQLRGWINVFKMNWQMEYTPRAVVPLPMTLFQAEGNDDARLAGWYKLGLVDTVQASGDHMAMMNEPHVQKLARQLQNSWESRKN